MTCGCALQPELLCHSKTSTGKLQKFQVSEYRTKLQKRLRNRTDSYLKISLTFGIPAFEINSCCL